MSPVVIKCPVKGMWSFMNPPGHHPDAKDFVAVDIKGKPYRFLSLFKHLIYRLKVEHIFAWEQPVYAPFDGTVIETQNNCVDRTKLNLIKDIITALVLAPRQQHDDTAFYFGNHVVIQSDSGVYALYAHLRQKSLGVKKGDRIKSGEFIARVGNSGNSIQPHLHFHLMETNNPLMSMPLPFVFEAYEKKQDGMWCLQHQSLPGNRQVFNVGNSNN